jgi:hypothetical protein
MRFIILLMTALTFAGCASSTPHNPLKREAAPLWWQKTTVGVSKADNPWEKFNQPKPVRDADDLWADFDEPVLFTKEFIKRERAKKAKDEAIRRRFRKMLEKAFYPKEI